MKKTKGKPDEMDVHVGKRLKVRRSLLGLSQEKLADAVGLTFQQVQKYEKGINRISAGKLFQFSQFLNVPVSYFYDNVENSNAKSIQAYGAADNEQSPLVDPGLTTKEQNDLEMLIKYYRETKGEDFRKEILRNAENISELSKKRS